MKTELFSHDRVLRLTRWTIETGEPWKMKLERWKRWRWKRWLWKRERRKCWLWKRGRGSVGLMRVEARRNCVKQLSEIDCRDIAVSRFRYQVAVRSLCTSRCQCFSFSARSCNMPASWRCRRFFAEIAASSFVAIHERPVSLDQVD